jgi:tetratricopeptide (TPR) repeat protein
MAAAVTVRLHKPEEDGALIAVFMARAHCLAGNARRLIGSEVDAEIAFGNTAYFLARSPVSCDRAFYCRSLAVLRWEQGRIDEAVALLFHSAGIFEENGAVAEESTCLALAGLLYLEEGDAQRALAPLRTARLGMPAPCRPWLSIRSRLALALALADLGHLGRARWMRQEAWRLYSLLTSEDEQFHAHWLEGRICVRLGAWQEAFDLLDGVRARFTAAGLLPEAALATLDLALLLARSNRTPEIGALIESFAAAFGAVDGLDIALRGLRSFPRDLETSRNPAEIAAGIASYLRRTFRFRGFRVEPLPFA